MFGGLTRRGGALAALASLAAMGPVSAPQAQPRYAPDQPTPDACARLGYAPGGSERDDMRRSRASGGLSGAYPSPTYAPPPPPPPPRGRAPDMPSSIPPLPLPLVEKRIEQSAPQAMAGGGRFAPPSQSQAGAVDTERYPNATPNPVKRTAQEPVSTFSIDVDTASYSNVRRFLNDGTRPPRDAVRVEEMLNYFDYGYALPRDRVTPFASFVAVTPSPWSRDRQILHVGLQGYELSAAAQPPLNLVFLIDTSGSMSGEGRLPLARKAMNLLIDQLGPQDRVSMVAYAGSAGAVLAPTFGRDKLRMRCALGALEAGGSTAGGQGLALAYAMAKQNFNARAVNRVVLMTDGDFNVGVADPAKLKDFVAEQRRGGVYLSVYGFGRGNYNDTMMQTLAQNGNGTDGYIDTLAEARKSFAQDFSGSLFPIADDVKIQIEFNPTQVSEYRLIGYETRLLNREDFNNDRVDAGEVGSGAAVTALYEITPAGARPSADPLRYGRRPTPVTGPTGELAFLKIRYKRPGAQASQLIERPITQASYYADVRSAPEPTRWALAVAGFGQKLRGDPWVDERFGWPEIEALAQGARGGDPFGERAEFVQLVRAAGQARPVNE
ncbi:MAG: VWA domain-containing protein [Phenylobacterium sp.]|uniref:vWA domain-containing protein n=1 Tax=Phenylobacterium sp. TaxID=1871053 RepID=UPI002735D418|nr:VWA domain-containing protein [Phenylobacterium sp.]MDP3174575.1 VWA domain-containing protein [Phenylobacterium sp.]